MNRRALITGASGGIGQACARMLDKEYDLILHYNQNRQACEKLASSLSGEPVLWQSDFSSRRPADNLPGAEEIDIVIHCAGRAVYGLFQDFSAEDWETCLRMEVAAPAAIIRAVLPGMIRKEGGSVVLVTSIWGETGASMETMYSTVKSAQHGLVKSLAKEAAPSGIRINAAAPGPVETPMMDTFSSAETQSLKEEIPAGRFASPEEVASAAVYLSSGQAAYINGHILSINGAWYT
ncbi:elongation factor P 5-aminopentanone reductase [Alkalicoccus urumqiensis]|uniref:Short chain dehydrogenase n=1 Tax=Alkalicoccus urumqiensis TaxID=1548213 RepID=A0A2P6MFV5_ALKUR|nr:SDR family oxidoreductase [Alkalicoccus urumqiensis]PRO65175.1 short chain dehydrogenase [Alkalicoccus urumqiensis]